MRLAKEYEDDADKLGVREEAMALTQTVVNAANGIPFPEETIVSESDVVKGVLGHFTGGRSAKDQVSDRIGKLVERYEEWWKHQESEISKALTDFQGSLISKM